MPLGTILLHSPGWNEGKARYETLGIHEQKVISSFVGAALTARVLGHLLWGCAAPLGLKKCISMLNPGLAPWALQGCRPYRALLSKCIVLVSVSARTCVSECVVLVLASASYLLECLRVFAEMSTSYLLQCLRVLTFVSART